jgi:hypothetical protein
MANNNIHISVTTNADSIGKKFNSLSSSITSSIKQADAQRRAFKFLDDAVNSGKISLQSYSRMVEDLNREEKELYSSLRRTTSAIKTQGAAASSGSVQMSNAAAAAERLTKRQRMAGKSTNRFGMYAQQVGYQVGDFAVQVQSGANALVAFGQQGTQLAGLLPGIYGAILGIGLSVTTAVLQSSGALKGLTFDFKRFKEDALNFIDPIVPALRLLGDVFSWVGGRVVDSLNLAINAFQYVVAFWRSVPKAIGVGVSRILDHFTKLELKANATYYRVASAWQKMKDTVSGSVTMISVEDIDSEGNLVQKLVSQSSEFENYYRNLSSQAAVLAERLKDSEGASSVIADSLKDVERIDLRNLLDYFSFSDKVAEESAKSKKATEEVEKAYRSLGKSIESSMEKGFMSMVDGTKSVEDAFKDMAKSIIAELYRILVVKRMVGNFESGTGIMGMIGGFFGGGSAPTSSIRPQMRPSSFDGGGYTGSGPRSGGMDGRGGYMAMLHPRETVIDHTKAGSAGGGESVTVVNNFNFQANGDDSVKRIIAQAAPSIANMAKQSVMDSRRRGGAMKNTFG